MQKTNKYLEHFRSLNLFEDGEVFVGAFLARCMPSFWWFMLLGPFAAFRFKQYQVVVSDRRIFFAKLSTFGKSTLVDPFTFDEIEYASYSKRLLSYRIKLRFRNGRKLRIDAHYRGVGRIEGFVLKPDVLEALQRCIK